VPVGALLAYGATGDMSPIAHVLATALGGTIAFAAHSAKVAARVSVTPSPEPFSNIALSTAEDALAIFLMWFATRHPFWAAAIVIGLLAAIVVLAGWISSSDSDRDWSAAQSESPGSEGGFRVGSCTIRGVNDSNDDTSEDFATLFAASVQTRRLENGQTVDGVIVAIGPEGGARRRRIERRGEHRRR
jgi:hypothetical protein